MVPYIRHTPHGTHNEPKVLDNNQRVGPPPVSTCDIHQLSNISRCEGCNSNEDEQCSDCGWPVVLCRVNYPTLQGGGSQTSAGPLNTTFDARYHSVVDENDDMNRAVAWPKYAGGQCLLSKYQVAISVLLLGIINLKNHKNWKSQGGAVAPLAPPQATALMMNVQTLTLTYTSTGRSHIIR